MSVIDPPMAAEVPCPTHSSRRARSKQAFPADPKGVGMLTSLPSGVRTNVWFE